MHGLIFHAHVALAVFSAVLNSLVDCTKAAAWLSESRWVLNYRNAHFSLVGMHARTRSHARTHTHTHACITHTSTHTRTLTHAHTQHHALDSSEPNGLRVNGHRLLNGIGQSDVVSTERHQAELLAVIRPAFFFFLFFLFYINNVYTLLSLSGNSDRLTWVSLQQPQEQRCPVLHGLGLGLFVFP